MWILCFVNWIFFSRHESILQMKVRTDWVYFLIINRPDSKLRYPVPLKDYHIPFSLRFGLNQGKPGEDLSVLLEQEVGLQMPQYPEKFASLLHIEELQMEVDIRHYDMEDTILIPEGQFLVLKVWYWEVCMFRWLKTVSSTFQGVNFDGLLQPLSFGATTIL